MMQVMSRAWHDASEHCHRFVVIARDGAAGAHFINTLNSLRDISALQAPFGFGMMEVRTGRLCSFAPIVTQDQAHDPSMTAARRWWMA
jgi:hypothetical protein